MKLSTAIAALCTAIARSIDRGGAIPLIIVSSANIVLIANVAAADTILRGQGEGGDGVKLNITTDSGGEHSFEEASKRNLIDDGDGSTTTFNGPPFDGPHEYIPDQLIVRFGPRGSSKSKTSAADKAAAAAAVGATKSKSLSRKHDIELLKFPPGSNLKAKMKALGDNPNVQYAELDYKVYLDVANDPSYTDGTLWGMQGPASNPANEFGSNAAGAWAKGFTGSHSVVVGVIDTGIQYDHPDLAANMWRNPGEFGLISSDNGIDDDGNGYIDDLYGWDFYNDDSSVYDYRAGEDSHGTHCAGTIGGMGNNNLGVAGVNWAVKMISGKFLGGSGGTGPISGAVAAINYMVDLKVDQGVNLKVLNNSWGGGSFTQSLLDAINYAGDQDILFVATAGNHGRDNDKDDYFPANYLCDNGGTRGWDCIISVANIQSNGAKAWDSGFGATTVDIGAPGTDIWSTIPFNLYCYKSGTSMAAPHVSGALALCASVNPTITAQQMKNLLMQTAVPTASLNGKVLSNGRLDVEALLDLCATPCTSGADCNDNFDCTDDVCNLETNFCQFNPITECWCDEFYCTLPDCSDGLCTGDCFANCCFGSAQCNDGLACNGEEWCDVTFNCVAGVPQTGCCGNLVCEEGEDIFNCNSDCDDYNCGTDCKTLQTTFAGGFSSNGNYFKVQAVKDVVVTSFAIHTTNNGTGTVKIYEKEGNYIGHEQDYTQWNQIMNDATIVGAGNSTVLPDLVTPVFVPAGTNRSFYIWTTLGVEETEVSEEGDIFAENPGELIFYVGKASVDEFACYTFGNSVWNGIIEYGLETATPQPSEHPTPFPTSTPTGEPTMKPSASPTNDHTASPSKVPTDSSSTSPTKKPTGASTKVPTDSPSTSPTKNPTGSPTKKPEPTSEPTAEPTPDPTSEPTAAPTSEPTVEPTSSPTKAITSVPTTTSPTKKDEICQVSTRCLCGTCQDNGSCQYEEGSDNVPVSLDFRICKRQIKVYFPEGDCSEKFYDTDGDGVFEDVMKPNKCGLSRSNTLGDNIYVEWGFYWSKVTVNINTSCLTPLYLGQSFYDDKILLVGYCLEDGTCNNIEYEPCTIGNG